MRPRAHSQESTCARDEVIKADPGVKLIAKQPADFDRAKGLSVMENILQVNRNIQGAYLHRTMKWRWAL
jgi:ABC-type sugar transport system substrate-binding protein